MKWYLNNFTEFVSVLVAIVYYPYLKGTVMKWVLPFLMFVFLGELFATRIGLLYTNNLRVYCFISIVESVFYGYLFYKICDNKSFKKMTLVLTVIDILAYVSTFFVFKKNTEYTYLVFIISGFFLSTIALCYIYLKFVDDDVSVFLVKEPGFWIAFGVSLFFSGTTIVFAMHSFIVSNDLRLFGIKLHNIVPKFLSIILYLSISIAIILCKKKTRISE